MERRWAGAVFAEKTPAKSRLAWFWICTALLWLVYIVGDSAGYPVSRLFDWDEALLKFELLCHSMMQALLVSRNKELNGGGNT